MCGIAGFSISPRETCDVRRLAVELLKGIEYRGRDAAGAAWVDGNEDTWTQKDNVPASKLLRSFDLTGDTKAAILHTRWATLGAPEEYANNHPVDVGGTIGVHNGVISNHREVFDGLGADRIGQVDSEAIFALLQYGPDVFHGAAPVDLLPLVAGSMAIAWLRPHAPRPTTLRLARGAHSPLVVATTKNGSAVFASTRQVIVQATRKAGTSVKWMTDIDEGTYLRIRDGVWHDVTNFTPDSGGRQFGTTNYAGRSQFERTA